jgi:hypothetical protein
MQATLCWRTLPKGSLPFGSTSYARLLTAGGFLALFFCADASSALLLIALVAVLELGWG